MIHRFGPQRHSKKALNSWNPWQDHSRMHTVYVSKWLLQRRSRGCCIPLARWEHDPLVGDTRLNFSFLQAAQAEVNHPQWEKAIERIYPRAKEMMSKPRYWHVAYPLAVTALCVAPHQFFLKNWMGCFEYGISKLKVSSRVTSIAPPCCAHMPIP